MMKLLDSMRIGFSSFVEDGQYFMLFMVAVLMLWLMNDSKKKEIRWFTLIMLVLLLCPITAKLLLLYQTQFYGYESLWELLPVTAILVYGLVTATFQIIAAHSRGYGRWESAAPKRKENAYEILVVVVLTAVLFLCGTLTPANALTDQTSGMGRVPAEAEEVFNQVNIAEGDSITLLAPDEIAAWARIYSGDILLPYGRNMWEPELTAYTYDNYEGYLVELHGWVNGSLLLPDQFDEAVFKEEIIFSNCYTMDYDYIVFSIERASQEVFEEALKRQNGYVLAAQTDGYVIYSQP